MMSLATGLVVVTVVLPIVRLACRPGIVSWMAEAWRVYRGELMESLGVSLASGAAAVAMGVGLAMGAGWRNVATAVALAFGILPGALVGEALVAAYLNVGVIYDYWPIVVLSYVARFGWVGVLAGLLAMRSSHQDLIQQARTDGADELNVDARIRLWPNWPVLAGGVCIVAAFSLADVTAISLVRVPSVGTISLTLIEKMHRFEEGMLVSLSLWLVAAALPAAALAAIVLRRRA
jgi:ABC-type Fe3+ transport system permease subunit